MKTGFLYFLSAAGLFIVSCNHKQTLHQISPGNSITNNSGTVGTNNHTGKDSLLSASWYVKGCAENTIQSKFKDYPDLPVSVGNGIRGEGDSIIYKRYVSHGCCRKVRVNTEKQGNVITISEFWWGRICKCMCSSDVKAVIRHLSEGTYQVYAIETGTDPIDDKPNDGKDTVMRQLITIK